MGSRTTASSSGSSRARWTASARGRAPWPPPRAGKTWPIGSLAAKGVAALPAAMQRAGAWLREAHKLQPVAVGHRVVHGGPAFDRPVLIDDSVMAQLEQYTSLAPLHQPNNLAP